MENRNININDVVEHRRHSKRAKLIFSGQQILLIFNGPKLIFVDFDKIFSPHPQLSSRTGHHLPTIFSHKLLLQCGSIMGSFVFDGGVFILGGRCSYYLEDSVDFNSDTNEYGLPTVVFEMDLDFAQPNFSPMDFLIPSKTIPRISDAKKCPIVETIENRVYILDQDYDEYTVPKHHFEALDLDNLALGWKRLPNPCYVKPDPNGGYYQVVLLSHYVVGSRLFVLVAELLFSALRWYFFDTEKESWDLAEYSYPPWFGQNYRHFPCVTKPRLGNNHVLISFNSYDEELNPERRRLFATLITREGKPVWYQEIFTTVFPNVDTDKLVHLNGGIADIGNDLFCAIYGCYDEIDDETFLFFSKFELHIRDKDGCVFVAAAATTNKDELPQERQFLDVLVHDSKIYKTNQDPFSLRIDAAYLI